MSPVQTVLKAYKANNESTRPTAHQLDVMAGGKSKKEKSGSDSQKSFSELLRQKLAK